MRAGQGRAGQGVDDCLHGNTPVCYGLVTCGWSVVHHYAIILDNNRFCAGTSSCIGGDPGCDSEHPNCKGSRTCSSSNCAVFHTHVDNLNKYGAKCCGVDDLCVGFAVASHAGL